MRRIIWLLIFLCGSASVQAQVNWPSPEVEQMYTQAREMQARGNIRQAIPIYQQAIQIAPNVMVLHRELGKAYQLTGANEEARKTLEPIVESGDADEQTYSALAACYAALGEQKKAKRTFEQGLERFPHSGILYNGWGKMQEANRDAAPEDALRTWIKGIEADPAYHLNYYDAARAYMFTTKPVWAVIYGEIFLNMEQQTPRANDIRAMLLKAYERLYRSIAMGEVPKYGSRKTSDANNGFEQAVYNTFLKLSPIVVDGITTENLIMLRTRFIMDWQLSYANQYPFSLFSRHDEMIRNGYFDVYNQWLFGKAENAQQFEAWNKFHAKAMPQFEAWLKNNPFRPVAGDAYNTAQVEDIFPKPDNKR